MGEGNEGGRVDDSEHTNTSWPRAQKRKRGEDDGDGRMDEPLYFPAVYFITVTPSLRSIVQGRLGLAENVRHKQRHTKNNGNVLLLGVLHRFIFELDAEIENTSKQSDQEWNIFKHAQQIFSPVGL